LTLGCPWVAWVWGSMDASWQARRLPCCRRRNPSNAMFGLLRLNSTTFWAAVCTISRRYGSVFYALLRLRTDSICALLASQHSRRHPLTSAFLARALGRAHAVTSFRYECFQIQMR
jgi:hypothetical protein